MKNTPAHTSIGRIFCERFCRKTLDEAHARDYNRLYQNWYAQHVVISEQVRLLDEAAMDAITEEVVLDWLREAIEEEAIHRYHPNRIAGYPFVLGMPSPIPPASLPVELQAISTQ